jgi:hypothetical protein
MKKVRKILYGVAIASGIFAGYLSFQTEARWSRDTVGEGGTAVSDAVDTAKDGGAAGFAILSGLALVAASITYLKNEE